MLKKVTLYGELAEKYGKDWSLDIESPAEAIRALCVNNKGFRQFVSSSEDRGMGYKVIVGTYGLEDVVGEMHNPTGRQEIKIVPVVLGAKRGIGQIIIGMIIIYAAVMTGGTALTALQASTVAAGGTVTGGVVINGMFVASGSMGMMALKFGAAMVLGGIASMLAPTPVLPDTADKPTNYGFDGAANTARQGYAIPVAYGQLLIGGAVISSGVSPEDYTP
jgi:predicted phage tail protein